MRIKILSGLAFLALAACGPAATPVADTSAGAAALPTENWAGFRDAFIEGWFRIDPANAVYQGRHDFDGGLGDWSAAGLKRQGDFLKDAIAKANGFTGLNAQDAFERDYLVNVAQGKLFWLEDADQPHTNPAWYIGSGLDPNVYIARNYADPATRMRAMINFLRKIPDAAKNIRANLKTPMPLSFVNYGAAGFNGFADYYTGDAKKAFAGVESPAMQDEFDKAAGAASKAMKDLGGWLEAQRPNATHDFALGADRFSRMVKMTEGVDVPLAELERAGQVDLKRNQDALKAACAQFAPGATIQACMAKMNDNKAADGPVAEARRQIPELTAFVLARVRTR